MNDIVVITHEMGNLHAACYGLIPGDRGTNYLVLHITVIGTWWFYSMHTACYDG